MRNFILFIALTLSIMANAQTTSEMLIRISEIEILQMSS